MAMEIKSFHIQDSGDPGVGIPATSYELSGGFSFDTATDLEAFKDDLEWFLAEHGFIQGKATVITDVEHQSRLEAEKLEVTAWMETMREINLENNQ